MNLGYNHALSKGTRIESYEVQDVLGVGGFGITYRAHDHTLNQTVAIKEYLPDGLAYRLPDGETLTHRSESDVKHYKYGLDRFLDEARTLAKFRDPSIVRVIRFIEANGTAYLVMDFESGDSLAQRLRARGVLREDEITALLTPLLQGLRNVHAQQFLHRDVKPANIVLRTEGPPVLLDFGAARQALGEHTKALTAMVTPGYAPFEQYHTKDRQGPWTDLYSVGATIYHCMTGMPPPAATERVAALYDGEIDPVDKPLELAGQSFSPLLLDIARWLLAPHAKDRPQSTDAVLRRLKSENGDADWQRYAGRSATGSAAHDVPATQDARAAAVGPEVLKTVHASLEPHIGPMAEALVRKAGKQVSNVEELTQLLARFIPSEEEKTQFLGKTRMLNTQELDQAAQVAGAIQSPPPAREEVSEHAIQRAKECLATYVGPIAGMLVRKAAKRADSREEFVRRLAGEIPDEVSRAEFLRAINTQMG
ncbi:MAG: serine/threonine protein kinase [Gammaproteobacteria bacterium]|nr:serine/threonine protein kinase [Gammaproteobacteria bacterium]